MSYSTTPTLPWVLPMYEKMKKHLVSTQNSDTQLPQIRTAASAALAKLDKYYFKAVFNQYNIIATMLHPHLGLRWFRRLGDPDRAEHAKVLFETASKGQSKQANDFLEDVMMNDISSDEEDDNASGIISEYDRFYIAYKNIDQGDANDPLAWWKLHESKFPIITTMARDFLAIPGTSVSVERLFSTSRQLCTEVRSSLKADTIMKAMLTKAWIKAGLFFFN
ncbi:uncharacterized protein ARMOST_15272 [Armillaria ostoyae]|uniref:HAT C-terminal dimerisation domain-containing protein n=1 Tax=Armillaria ostoyae TaxID=47428 RepID=A0A284RSW2_ARMOS|nr:uncharacterized protein ARMOST_15272 [Armillaria ostoyae]